ncbi:hypothetical protein C8R48DRAFT_710848 [Suillus tomentosus]|nr:hypothetical protein C8R48DRAFT_710848 [Suillus tomentosus]
MALGAVVSFYVIVIFMFPLIHPFSSSIQFENQHSPLQHAGSQYSVLARAVLVCDAKSGIVVPSPLVRLTPTLWMNWMMPLTAISKS